MIIDALLQLSGSISGNTITPQSLVGAGGVTVSSNVIDLSQARDLGQGNGLDIMVEVVQAFAGGTSLSVALVVADDAAITTNVTYVLNTATIPTANLTAGAQIPIHIDRVAPLAAHRYMALRYTTSGTFTAGSVVAEVVAGVQDSGNNTLFPSGFSVS